MSTVLVLILSTLIFFVISLIYRGRRFLYLASKIPSPKRHFPFIGIIPSFLGAELHDVLDILLDLYQKIGRNFMKFWFGNQIIIVVTTPEVAQQVLNAKECLDKPKFFGFFGLPNATLHGTLDGWKRHRKILNPAFNLQVLKSFVPTFDEKSKKLVKSFESLCGKEFDVFPHNSAFFLETILNAALDLKVDIMNHKDKEFYVQHFDDYHSAVCARMTKFWLHFEPFYKLTSWYKIEMDGRTKSALKLVDKIYETALKNREEDYDDGSNANAIKAMTNPKHNLSEKEVKEEIFGLILAGQDSSTIVLSTTLIMLAMHKRVQDKALEELREVFTSVDDPVDIDILTKLPYLEMVIKESMRLFPISPITFRTSTQEFKLNGCVIPTGANFVLGVYMLHRDTAFWGEDAEVFIPERWEPERIKKVHPYAYLPFSGGPRYCVGSKYAMLFLKTCLSNLLRNFEIDTPLKMDELTFRLSITMKFLQPYLISLKKRNF